ncbi:MAG: tetratricopeptide repeat protein, partial [Faecalibacillus intestinalis]
MNKKQKSVKYIVPCIIIVVISIIISLVFVFNHTNTKEYDNKLEEAQKYVEEMDYEKAEATYLEAIKIDSKQSKAYLKLADIYVKQNKIDKFINILEKGIKNVDKDDRKK